MKLVQLIVVFCFMLPACFGQTIKSATIIKADSTKLKVYGLKIQGNQIIYYLFPSVNAKTIRTSRIGISRIIYSNGQEEIIGVKPIPKFLLRTAFTGGQIPLSAVEKKRNKGFLPDRIYKKDGGIIECRITEIDRKEIKYVVLTDQSQRVRTINQKEIERVEQNTSKENLPIAKVIPKTPPAKVSDSEKPIPATPAKVVQSTKKQEAPPKETEDVTTLPKTSVSDYSYSTLTLGLEAAQMLTIGSSQLADERDGLGLKRAIGGSIRATKRINRTVGLVAEIGFTKWASEYRVKNDADLLATYSNGLSRLSVSAGAKFYFGKAFYVLPKAHIEGLQLRQTGHDRESISMLDRVQRTIYWGGSGTFGYEHHVGSKYTADVSIGYNYLAKPLPMLDYAYPPNKPLHLISFRVAFGLISYRTLTR
jgi:hypothetical protein